MHVHSIQLYLLSPNILVAIDTYLSTHGLWIRDTERVEVKAVEHQSFVIEFSQKYTSIELRNNFQIFLFHMVGDMHALLYDIERVFKYQRKVIILGQFQCF